MKLGEAIYKAQADAAPADDESEVDEGPSAVDEDIVDADFEDLDDERRS